jgi:hypothetical protein
MSHLTAADLASRTMAEKHNPKRWKPGGERGKLHRELGIPEGQKIPAGRLASAEHSSNPEVRRDAIRAKTMEGWRHPGRKKRHETMYDHPRSGSK